MTATRRRTYRIVGIILAITLTLLGWWAFSGRPLATLRGHVALRIAIAFAPDGKLLASVDAAEVVRIWDLTTFRQRQTMTEMPDWATRDRQHSPDDRLRVETNPEHSYRTLTLSDAATGRKLVTLDGHPNEINDWAFSPDGAILATGGGSIDNPWPVSRAGDARIWDVNSGRLLATLSDHWGAVCDVEFSPDGKLLATASYDGTIKLYDVARILPGR